MNRSERSRKIWRIAATPTLVLGLTAVLVIGLLAGRFLTERALRPLLYAGEPSELEELIKRYGPEKHSLAAEEWIVRDYFHDKRGGVFLDVGANDYELGSNTYFLETALGWSGLAIEPQAKFAAGYAKHRPRTRFVQLFVSDVADQTASLFVGELDMNASATPELARGDSGTSLRELRIKTTTLDDILVRTGNAHIDFLSLDVELHEPQALAGFSIDRVRPALACVEAHPAVRQAILDYFQRHDYRLIGKYLRADRFNLWFEPVPHTAGPPAS